MLCAVQIFGEILPQAVCVRYGLAIGVAFRWPVRIMMWLTSPISWPLARILDWLLGKEGANVFRRHELKVWSVRLPQARLAWHAWGIRAQVLCACVCMCT